MPVQEKSNMSNMAQSSSSKMASSWQSKGDGDQEDFSVLMSEVSSSIKKYCSQRPAVVAGTLFAIGFILGWKMRPW